MELTPLSLSFLATSLLLLLSLLLLKMRASKHKNLPPGPWTLPFIGSLHHLATSALPHRVLCDLARTHGPVMMLRAGETDLAVLSSREAALEVMKTQDTNFAYRPELAATKIVCYGCTDIAFSQGPYWRQLRRICVTELLSPKRVKSFASIRKEEVYSMLKELKKASAEQLPVNLSEKIFAQNNNIVCRTAFGDKCHQQGRFLVIVKEALELASGFTLSDVFPSLKWLDVRVRRKLQRIHREMDGIFDEIVRDHLHKQDEVEEEVADLVDVLLKAKKQGELEVPITLDNVKAVILDIFTGGTDTSSSTIEWAMSELIRNPNTMAKAQEEIRQVAKGKLDITENDIAELSYLKLVIKETLRLHPPVPMLVPRLCQETCQVLDFTIPAGTRVVINAWALGRNPQYWKDAETFKPERFQESPIDYKGNNFEFLPFGAGRRICPGITFGMTVVEVALARLLYYFDWKLPEGMSPEDLDMTETSGATSSRKYALHLIPTPYLPLFDV